MKTLSIALRTASVLAVLAASAPAAQNPAFVLEQATQSELIDVAVSPNGRYAVTRAHDVEIGTPPTIDNITIWRLLDGNSQVPLDVNTCSAAGDGGLYRTTFDPNFKLSTGQLDEYDPNRAVDSIALSNSRAVVTTRHLPTFGPAQTWSP